MLACDALIVGGGPAGSTAAWALRRAGWDVVVVDRARFPRDKVCAGWLTPHVLDLLEFDTADYRARGLTFQEMAGFTTSVIGARPVHTAYPHIVSYGIRRCEFDDYLLRRAGVRVLEATGVTSLERTGDAWVVNGLVKAPVVIGAGGHFCPVARQLRREADVPDPVVAKEAEFRLENGSTPVEGAMPELFFCHDLEGYAWCVRKGDYVNVGIGRRESRDFGAHVERFVAFLEESGRAPGASKAKWKGHAYLAAGVGTRPLTGDGLLLVGDAAGLAYPESGEGIRPAIESALLAAGTLAGAGQRPTADDLRAYESRLRARYPPSRPLRGPLAGAFKAVGRALMKSPAFTRHVLLNRWFLRMGG